MVSTTLTIIQLVQGKNYISFPASYAYNFRILFTESGIMNDIMTDVPGNKLFYKYDPIFEQGLVLVDLDFEYIEPGKGYRLDIISESPGSIIYDGIEYTITFDQFKSRVVKGLNLLGVGKDQIIPQAWCKIFDPKTMTPVTILEPKHAYAVYYDDCIQPVAYNVGSSSFAVIAGVGTILFAYYMLSKFGIVKRID